MRQLREFSALRAGVPIIPITIIGSRQILPPDEIILRAGLIEMYVDAPIPTASLTDEDIDALMKTVYDRMAKHFNAK